MPKETKEVKKNSNSKNLKNITEFAKNVVKKVRKTANASEPKKSVAKKSVATQEKATSSTAVSTQKKSTLKKSTSVSKKTTSTPKKDTTTKNNINVAPAKVKVSDKTSDKTKSKTKDVLDFSPEYYDLPYRYNQTMVKILAQTPSHIFAYWDISDEDRENLKKKFGEYFFEITKPVLIIHNENLNYSFEVDINDFANSWYININDSNCEYSIELGRRPIPINYTYLPNYDIAKNGPIHPIETPYIYISSSNELEVPNDHILSYTQSKIYFRNIKTNQIIEKDLKDFKFILDKDNNFKNIFELYQNLYKEEISNNSFNLNNPSSGNPSSSNVPIRFK